MKKLGKLLRNMLLVCGVLFIIVLLLPDDEEKVRISALLHDITKEYTKEQQLAVFADFGMEVDAVMRCSGEFLSGRYGKGETDRDKRRWKGPSDRVCLYERFGSGIGGRRGNGGSL